MALVFTNRGDGSSNTNTTSTVATPSSNFTAGSTAVLWMAYDNSGTGGSDPFTSISDSIGNTWTTRQSSLNDPNSANQGHVLRIFTSDMSVGALTTSSTVTVAHASTQGKVWGLVEVRSDLGGSAIYQTGNKNTFTGTTPSITTSTLENGDGVIGVAGIEEADTWSADTDTTDGSWSTFIHKNGGGAGAAGTSGIEQHKVVTATGTQTFNPTCTNSSDGNIAWVSFRDSAATVSGSFTADAVLMKPVSGSFTADAVLVAAAEPLPRMLIGSGL